MGLSAVLVVSFWPSSEPRRPVLPDLAGFDPAVTQLIHQASQQIERNQQSAQAWGDLGLILQNYERPKEAQACLERARQLAPADPRWPFFLGMLSLPSPASIGHFQEAAALCDTNSDIPYLRLGQTLAEHGRPKEAAQAYEALLRFQPQNAAARLGLARTQIDRPEQAAETLAEALTDERTAQNAYHLLAVLQQRLGNQAAADRARQIALSLPPDQRWPDPLASEAARWRAGEQAQVDHGQQLLAQGKPAEALALAKRLVDAYPRSVEGWLLLARTRFESQDCAGAEAALRQHLQLSPESVNGFTQLGISLLCQNRLNEAATAFHQALRLKPDLGQAHFNLGYVHAQSGDLSNALNAFQEAVRLNPDFTEAYQALAEVCTRSGDTASAREWNKRAAQLRQ